MVTDYAAICQEYITSGSVVQSSCADLAGNLYGSFSCVPQSETGSTYPSDIVYNTSGIFVSYPTLFCGNRRPIAPNLLAGGSLEWNERIEFGMDNCVQGGRASLTQVSSSGDLWQLYWIGGGVYETEMMTTLSQCTRTAACSDLELEAQDGPIFQSLNETRGCSDRFGNPFGTYSGTMLQTFTQTEIPMELTYDHRGVTVTYTAMDCGNLLPISPTVASNGALEWNERIEYGLDNCAAGGKVSLTKVEADEWELFWISSGTTPSGVAEIQLTQPRCSSAGDEGESENEGETDEEGETEEEGENETEDAKDDLDDEDDEEGENENEDAKDDEDDESENVDQDQAESETEVLGPTATPGVEASSPTAGPTSSQAVTTPAPTADSECQDASGVSYGTFQGVLVQSDNMNSYNVLVTYDASGVTVAYPAFECGNEQPLQADATSSGSLEWTEVLDYGEAACDGGGAVVTMTQVSETQWEFSWVGGAGAGSGVTSTGMLEFEPLCFDNSSVD